MAAAQQPPTTPLPPEQLQQLVAPIALYPDALVAQILAASTYPTQIVEAERFIQQNPNLTGAALGAEVDKQDWDPSVKAMTQFPSVLADMDKNLSWTSELGDTKRGDDGHQREADDRQADGNLNHREGRGGARHSVRAVIMRMAGGQRTARPAFVQHGCGNFHCAVWNLKVARPVSGSMSTRLKAELALLPGGISDTDGEFCWNALVDGSIAGSTLPRASGIYSSRLAGFCPSAVNWPR